MKIKVQGSWDLSELISIWKSEAEAGYPDIQYDFHKVIQNYNQKAPQVWEELFMLADEAVSEKR